MTFKKERKPLPKHAGPELYVTQKELGEYLGLTRARVSQLQTAGVIPPRDPSRGTPLRSSVLAFISHLQGRRDPKAEEEGFDYDIELAREKHYKAEKAKMDAEEQAGILVPVSEVVRAWSSVLVVVRSRLLSLPRRISRRIAKMSSVSSVRSLLTDEVKGILLELASAPIEFEDPDDEN